MEDFDEDPLDLLEDDGDGMIEMGLLLDEDGKTKPPGNGGCCVVLLGLGTSLMITGWGIMQLVA